MRSGARAKEWVTVPVSPPLRQGLRSSRPLGPSMRRHVSRAMRPGEQARGRLTLANLRVGRQQTHQPWTHPATSSGTVTGGRATNGASSWTCAESWLAASGSTSRGVRHVGMPPPSPALPASDPPTSVVHEMMPNTCPCCLTWFEHDLGGGRDGVRVLKDRGGAVGLASPLDFCNESRAVPLRRDLRLARGSVDG